MSQMPARRAGLWLTALLWVAVGPGAVKDVVDAAGLIAAIGAASPGDVIILAPGTYDLGRTTLSADTPGSPETPILVRAEELGDALILSRAAIAFRVSAPHWTFENLDIEGTCSNHSACEHAFQIVGKADFTTIRRCRMHEYNAMIKGNGEDPGGGMVFPDDVLVEFSQLFNSTVRNTGNPVTPIDVVGGQRWIVRANTISDFAKGRSDRISYAAFFKGNSKDGLFERNLVICELNHTEGRRLGLSFGGGGSDPPSICEDGICIPEHSRGVMRNNVIVSCPDDVGIYLNEAADSGIYNNTLFDTSGIDVRFEASVADLRNNILSGSIRERDGGTATTGSNLENVSEAEFFAWFTDPAAADFRLLDGTLLVDLGEALPEVRDDYCRNQRQDGVPDIGAVEYDGDLDCDTTSAGGGIGPTLWASRLVRGEQADFVVSELATGDRVSFLFSTSGLLPDAGPCPPFLLGECLDLLNPRLRGRVTAGADGSAVLTIPIPSGLAIGQPVFAQAVVRRVIDDPTLLETNTVIRAVESP
ncbi:MAG: PE-PGRS family protein [Acidobacteriota bacterium]